jgi:galactose mutarotase-like enzyme
MDDESHKDSTILSDQGDSVTVSPLGGLFTLTLRNTPILVPVVRGDGKSIRTHICTPNFGKDHSGVFSLKQHGNMRNELCDIKPDNSRIKIKHEITDSPNAYPKGVSVTVTMTLERGKANVTITHENRGDIPAPVNTGVHCYFNAPLSYRHTKINGHDMTKYVENIGNIELLDVNAISIPGLPKIVLRQSGFPKAVLWVYENQKGEKDADYVCIEPVEFFPEDFNKPQTLILPHTSRTCRFSLEII